MPRKLKIDLVCRNVKDPLELLTGIENIALSVLRVDRDRSVEISATIDGDGRSRCVPDEPLETKIRENVSDLLDQQHQQLSQQATDVADFGPNCEAIPPRGELVPYPECTTAKSKFVGAIKGARALGFWLIRVSIEKVFEYVICRAME